MWSVLKRLRYCILLVCCRTASVSEELASLAGMGTGRGKSNKRGQVPTNPGLLHRRYSVPETVMRKYSLTKQQSSSSDSGVATVPVETPDTLSSNLTLQPGSSSDEPTAGTSSPDSSDNSGKMGNITGKRTRSPVPSQSTTNEAPSRSTLDTVSEEISESVTGSISEDTLEPLSSLRDNSKTDRTSAEVPSSTPMKHVSPQGTAVSAELLLSVRGDMLLRKTVVGDNRPTSIPTEGVEQSQPNVTESTEPQNLVKGDLSSSQSPGLESTSNSPSSTLSKEAQSTESTPPLSSEKGDLSSSQTPGLESTDSRPSTLSIETYQSPQNITEYIEPQSVLQDKMSLMPTKETEPRDIRPQNMSNKESTRSPNSTVNAKEKSSNSRMDKSTHSNDEGSRILHPADETVKHRVSSRVDLSSSKTIGVASADRRSSTPDCSSVYRLPIVEFHSLTSTVTSNTSPLQNDRMRSSTSSRDMSCIPTGCSVSTPNPEQSQSLSSISDRASESCSITPMESSSSPERPSVAVRSPVSSASHLSSDHTNSVQDTMFSMRSNSTVLSKPASVIIEQSTNHTEFMNDSTSNNSKSMLNMLGRVVKPQSAQSHSEQTEDSGHAAQPNSKRGELSSLKNQNSSKTNEKVKSSVGSTQLANKQPITSNELVYCGHQSRSWEIVKQQTIMQSNSAKCPEDSSGNKEIIHPSKKADAEFCGIKTHLVMKPNSSTIGQADAKVFGTTMHPQPKSLSPGIQQVTTSHEVRHFTPAASEESGHYGWSKLTDEEHTVQLQLQRHRLWMNRKLSDTNALPPTPMHGPISSCVGTGSTYRKSYDVQLVIPRYSALPRSVSMLVNTSSGECSSNSNSDSECLSLVDSLEERPSSCTSKHKPTKHDSKPVRGDIVQLLPDDRNHKYGLHRRINAATPRGKGKAFFVSMATGVDEAGTVKVEENTDKQIVSQSMPDRLKKKLYERHQQINIKNKKIKGVKYKNKNGQADKNTEQKENICPDVGNSGVVSVQGLAGMQHTENKNALTQTSQTENKTQKEAKATETNGPIKPEQEIPSAELPAHITTPSTAIFHSAAHGNTGGGTFIVSRNEGQRQKGQKLLEQSIPVDISKSSSTGYMIKKEQISEEHSPPVKRFKDSKHDTPTHEDQKTPEQEATKILQNVATMHKEKKHIEQSALLETSNYFNDCTTVQKESKSSEKKPSAKTANSTGNGGKEQKAYKHGEEHKTDISTTEKEDVTSVTNITSQETSEEQRHSAKAEHGFRRKIQERQKSAKEHETNNSPGNEANESKSEGHSLPVESSLNETCALSEDKVRHTEMKTENGRETLKESSPSVTSEPILKHIETLEIKKTNCEKFVNRDTKAQDNDNEVDVDVEKNMNKVETQETKATSTSLAVRKLIPDILVCQKRQKDHGRKTDTVEDVKSKEAEKVPERKLLNTVSCQTLPELKCEEEKNSLTQKKDPQSKQAESSLHAIRNLIRTQLPLKSSIPIMKSPVGMRKLSPDTVVTLQQSLQNSHLPVHIPSRLIHAPPIRRSANLLGNRFHQRFEMIPEERSGSLESSTEDQSYLPIDRCPRPSLPARQRGSKVSTGSSLGCRSKTVSHSCLGLNQATGNKYRQKRHTSPNSETSSSNHENISNGDVRATDGDITRKIIQRPTCPSRIPRAEKMKRQLQIPEYSVCEGQEERKDYQGKAALAPHTEDKDLLTLSKGWINFYLLKDERGTPDSSCGEGRMTALRKIFSFKIC